MLSLVLLSRIFYALGDGVAWVNEVKAQNPLGFWRMDTAPAGPNYNIPSALDGTPVYGDAQWLASNLFPTPTPPGDGRVLFEPGAIVDDASTAAFINATTGHELMDETCNYAFGQVKVNGSHMAMQTDSIAMSIWIKRTKNNPDTTSAPGGASLGIPFGTSSICHTARATLTPCPGPQGPWNTSAIVAFNWKPSSNNLRCYIQMHRVPDDEAVTATTQDQWHFFVCRVTPTRIELWKDGVLADSSARTNTGALLDAYTGLQRNGVLVGTADGTDNVDVDRYADIVFYSRFLGSVDVTGPVTDFGYVMDEVIIFNKTVSNATIAGLYAVALNVRPLIIPTAIAGVSVPEDTTYTLQVNATNKAWGSVSYGVYCGVTGIVASVTPLGGLVTLVISNDAVGAATNVPFSVTATDLLGSVTDVTYNIFVMPQPTAAPTAAPTPSPTTQTPPGTCGVDQYFSWASNACTACPDGQVASTIDGNECECSAGSASTGAVFDPIGSNCVPCSIGMYCADGSTIVACAEGTIAPAVGTAACTACAPQTSNDARTQCVDCPIGEQSYGGACAPCAQGSYKLIVGAACLTCDPNAQCAGGAEQPQALPGYWGFIDVQTGVYSAFRCANVRICPGGAPRTCGADRDSSSPYCSLCAADYFSFNDECRPCPEQGWLLMLLVVFGCVLFLLFYSCFNRQLQSLGGIPFIMVTTVQMFAVISRFTVPWSPVLRDFLESFEFATLSVDAAGPECLGISWGWFEFTLLTLGIMTFLTLLALIPTMRTANATWRQRMSTVQRFFRRTFWLFLRVAYITVVSKVFAPFRCLSQPDGSVVVADSPEIKCFEDSRHWILFGFSIFGALLFVFFIPNYWAVRIHREGKVVRARWRAGLATHSLLVSSTDKRKICGISRKKGKQSLSDVSFLYEDFKQFFPEPVTALDSKTKRLSKIVSHDETEWKPSVRDSLAHYWMFVMLARKIALVLIAEVLVNGYYQVGLSMGVVLVNLIAQLIVRPYRYAAANRVEIIGLLCQLLLEVFALVSLLTTPSIDAEPPSYMDGAAYGVIVVIVMGLLVDVIQMIILRIKNGHRLKDCDVAYTAPELEAAEKSGMLAVAEATHAYDAGGHDDLLSFDAGRHIEVLDMTSDVEWRGRLRNTETVAAFPASHVKIVHETAATKAAREEREEMEALASAALAASAEATAAMEASLGPPMSPRRRHASGKSPPKSPRRTAHGKSPPRSPRRHRSNEAGASSTLAVASAPSPRGQRSTHASRLSRHSIRLDTLSSDSGGGGASGDVDSDDAINALDAPVSPRTRRSHRASRRLSRQSLPPTELATLSAVSAPPIEGDVGDRRSRLLRMERAAAWSTLEQENMQSAAAALAALKMNEEQ